MVFSYKLLSRWVDLSSTTPEALRSRLTFAGFEVEGMKRLCEASRLCIGHILTCEKHPDSDHLHCLTVDCGSQGIKNIVCGAPNARQGLNVIVALEGCVLPALGETIKKGTIRGKESEGMCCSLLELGLDKASLSEDSPSMNGIEELPEDAPVGETDVLGYLGLDDTVLDINVLPNRPDCLSYLGMAREIASLCGFALKAVPTFDKASFREALPVEKLTDRCSRFDMIRIADLKVKSRTPDRIQKELSASGIRPVSPLVDIGNYAMLLTGQPFNIYDSRNNPSCHYVVRDDLDGVSMETFDGKKIDLRADDLVITDGSRPLCLAGIVAGKDACVEAMTTGIDVEAAIFYHVNIRHTSNRVGISTPSSQLFGKERNPRMIDEALAIFVSLLPEFLDGYTLVGYGSVKDTPEQNPGIDFSLERLNHRLGGHYTEEEVDQVLKAYRIEKGTDGLLYGPIDRVDLLEQCDIEEEVFRYYGAEKLTPNLEHYPITHGGLSEEQKARRGVREMLIGRGFDEIISFTLIDEKMDKAIRVFTDDDSYRLMNPMTKDHEIVRSDLLPSMLQTIDYNTTHNNPNLRLFEVSNVDNPKQGSHLYMSIALRGEKTTTENLRPVPYDFFDMKGVIEAIMSRIGLPESRYRLSYTTNKAFHPYAACDIKIGKDLVGVFGRVHPTLRKDNVYLAEIDLGYLLSLKGLKTKFTAFNSETLIRRDLSFRIKNDVTYQKLVQTIRYVKDSYLDNVKLFDRFVDKETGEEYLGVSLYFVRPGKTLTSAEVDDAVSRIVLAVRSNLGLTLRGE